MTDIRVSPLTVSDAEALARLHREAFPDFFLSTLGVPFLRQFYAGFAADQSAVAFVAKDGSGRAIGAVVGTVEPDGYFSRLLRSRLIGFGLASARAAARRPRAASRLIRAVAYRGSEAVPSEGALLSSICVSPSARGTGAGRLLLARWERDVADRGVGVAFLTTDTDANEEVNAFYRAAAWQLHDTFSTREGRPMNRYTKHLRSP